MRALEFSTQFLNLLFFGLSMGFSSDIHLLDKELRVIENTQIENLLPLIKNKATELGNEFFEHFTIPEITSEHQAWEYRYLYVPILYKLAMTKEASHLAQVTFEYFFPHLHNAVKNRIQILFGEKYLEKCNALIEQFLCESDQIDNISFRIKSTHSIWKKIQNLETLERMTTEEFAALFNDFIGIRWEMKVLENGNRCDALMNGICLAPLINVKTLRNQLLPQESGFASEPIIKLCYLIDGFPIELQLLGETLQHICVQRDTLITRLNSPYLQIRMKIINDDCRWPLSSVDNPLFVNI